MMTALTIIRLVGSSMLSQATSTGDMISIFPAMPVALLTLANKNIISADYADYAILRGSRKDAKKQGAKKNSS